VIAEVDGIRSTKARRWLGALADTLEHRNHQELAEQARRVDSKT
jgi:hypothetical protein